MDKAAFIVVVLLMVLMTSYSQDNVDVTECQEELTSCDSLVSDQSEQEVTTRYNESALNVFCEQQRSRTACLQSVFARCGNLGWEDMYQSGQYICSREARRILAVRGECILEDPRVKTEIDKCHTQVTQTEDTCVMIYEILECFNETGDRMCGENAGMFLKELYRGFFGVAMPDCLWATITKEGNSSLSDAPLAGVTLPSHEADNVTSGYNKQSSEEMKSTAKKYLTTADVVVIGMVSEYSHVRDSTVTNGEINKASSIVLTSAGHMCLLVVTMTTLM